MARSVTLLVRGESPRGVDVAVPRSTRSRAIGNIRVRTCTTVVGAEGDGTSSGSPSRDAATGTTETVDASHLFVFIGAAPLTDWLDGVRRARPAGFVVTGPGPAARRRAAAGWTLDRDPYLLETSVPGVFVAGDVRAESVKRVASAVGEGAMAVTLVHRYLEKP